jgi:hypothetical protein
MAFPDDHHGSVMMVGCRDGLVRKRLTIPVSRSPNNVFSYAYDYIKTFALHRDLPFGTPDEVYTQVRERLHVFGPGGGFCVQSES